MSSSRNKKPASDFQGFHRLSANTWYLEAQENSPGSGVSISKTIPALVILSTWMDASPKHIAKYIAGYRVIYPKAAFVVITNSMSDVTYRWEKVQRDRLRPVLAIVEEMQSEASTPKPRILLHVFSNGGVNQACNLANMYREEHNSPLPVTGMILDSCPGKPDYTSGLAAFTVGLPKFKPLRFILLGLIHILLAIFYISNHLLPSRNLLEVLRQRLNDSTLFPLQAPRAYFYSKSDKMVNWEHVESHATEARKLGWKVDQEMFDGSAHVGHLVSDSTRYWKLVQNIGSA
jgi:hypothetical protein